MDQVSNIFYIILTLVFIGWLYFMGKITFEEEIENLKTYVLNGLKESSREKNFLNCIYYVFIGLLIISILPIVILFMLLIE